MANPHKTVSKKALTTYPSSGLNSDSLAESPQNPRPQSKPRNPKTVILGACIIFIVFFRGLIYKVPLKGYCYYRDLVEALMIRMGFEGVMLFILVELYGNERGYVLFRRKQRRNQTRKPHSKGPRLGSMQTDLLHPPQM